MSIPNDFDIEIYRSSNHDLQHMSNDQLIRHYTNHGQFEYRIYKNTETNTVQNTHQNTNKIRSFFNIISYINEHQHRKMYDDLKFLSEGEIIRYFIKYEKLNNIIPYGFDIDVYKQCNNDLSHMTDIELINHYINHGQFESRIHKNNDMKTRYIALGGWCGSTWSLRQNSLNDCDMLLPFDFIRSTFEGVIDCFENNFQNFFPKNIDPNISNNEYSGRNNFFSFPHHDLRKHENIEGFNRRIVRLNDYLTNKNEKVIFVRTIVTHNYEDEIALAEKFRQIINNKYPSLKYLLIFVIPEQPQTLYYKSVSDNIFLFTVDDIDHRWDLIGGRYKLIYDFIKQNDLFNNIPPSNDIIINNITGLHEDATLFRNDN